MSKKLIVTCKDYGRIKFDPDRVSYPLDFRFHKIDLILRKVTMKLFRRPGRYRLIQGTIRFQVSPCHYSRCNFQEGWLFVPTSKTAAFSEEEAERAKTLCSCKRFPRD